MAAPSVQLEWLLTAPKGFGLQTATPLQRAICRASDGVPLAELWAHPTVPAAFGGVVPPAVAPSILCILAAIRGAKSMISAAKAIACSQNCDLSKSSPGDEIRIPVLSTDKDTARVVYSHIVGNIQAKPALRALLIGEPTADSLYLRHPTGRHIEIKVTAMSKAGSTLVGRWLAGCIFDEAPRMSGASDAVENLDDALSAIAGRMLDGSQIMLIGSPWAPFGPVYDLVQEHFGKPSAHVVVVRGTGPGMNPVYWTPARCEKLRAQDPAAYRTDVLGEFADPEESIFSSVEVEASTRKEAERPPEPRMYYAAAMDPATRGNAWTLVVIGCMGLGGGGGIMPTYSVVLCRQWVGSKSAPLRPDSVLAEIAEICKRYRCESVVTDQHSVDALRDLAERHDLGVFEITINSDNRLEMVERARVLCSEGLLELPPDPQFRTDILSARKRVTQNGVTLILPRSGDGRHADYVPALGLALCRPPPPPDAPEPERGDLLDRHAQQLFEESQRDWMEQAALRISGG